MLNSEPALAATNVPCRLSIFYGKSQTGGLNCRGGRVRGEHACSRCMHRILIATSTYHTRRALAIFPHRLPQYKWSVAAAADESAYGTHWWRRRAWAKTWLGETERFAWWELVDRWRYGPIAI